MVHTKYNFKWFEKEDNRRALRSSISTDGKLRLGKPLCNVLPPYIRVGFDSKFKILAIADGHGTGIGRPHCGIMSAQALSAQIASTGLRFPLSFRLSRDERTGYFLGRIIPRRRLDKNSAQPQYDPEQLLILYQHLVDQMVSQLAKSTPLSERRACAAEAFYTAVQRYCPACGDLETYLQEQIQRELLLENKQHVAAYSHLSLDQPLTSDGEDDFCLYDALADASFDGVAAVEARIMAEQFLDGLSRQERRLVHMLQEGCLLSSIAEELNLTEDEITAMGGEIGRKRKAFYDVS